MPDNFPISGKATGHFFQSLEFIARIISNVWKFLPSIHVTMHHDLWKSPAFIWILTTG